MFPLKPTFKKGIAFLPNLSHPFQVLLEHVFLLWLFQPTTGFSHTKVETYQKVLSPLQMKKLKLHKLSLFSLHYSPDKCTIVKSF